MLVESSYVQLKWQEGKLCTCKWGLIFHEDYVFF